MMALISSSLKLLAEHPKAGVLSTVITLCAVGVGYSWGSSTFVAKEELAEALRVQKIEIVDTIDRLIIQRDIETKEETLRQYTQMIRLSLCPRDDCAYTQAEKETLERQIDALRKKLE